MTKIELEKYHDTYLFRSVGHTGFSTVGKDILCSAVSVLCYTLREYLENAYAKGDVTGLSYDFSEGSVEIDFSLREEDRATKEGVRAILFGFELLRENFPDHIFASLCSI